MPGCECRTVHEPTCSQQFCRVHHVCCDFHARCLLATESPSRRPARRLRYKVRCRSRSAGVRQPRRHRASRPSPLARDRVRRRRPPIPARSKSTEDQELRSGRFTARKRGKYQPARTILERGEGADVRRVSPKRIAQRRSDTSSMSSHPAARTRGACRAGRVDSWRRSRGRPASSVKRLVATSSAVSTRSPEHPGHAGRRRGRFRPVGGDHPPRPSRLAGAVRSSDRFGQADDNTSCWLRRSNWAASAMLAVSPSRGWGGMKSWWFPGGRI